MQEECLEGRRVRDVQRRRCLLASSEAPAQSARNVSFTSVQGDFGDPVAGTTGVAASIYNDAGTLVQEYVVDRAAQQCAGCDCWMVKGTKGYGYKDASADGMTNSVSFPAQLSDVLSLNTPRN
jgi:hypothetical protein